MEDTIIYEKQSNYRAKEFALETRIFESGTEGKYVEKSSTYPEGTKHVLEMQKHYMELMSLFQGSDIHILPCEKRDKSVVFPYIEGETLEAKVNRMVEQERFSEAKQLVTSYLNTIRRVHSQRGFKITEEFREVFGEFESDKKYDAAQVNDIDLVLDNIMVKDDEKYLIDYEWMFHFPIPIDYILFRILHYFIFRNAKRQVLIDHGFLYLLNYTQEDIACFLKMEANFQRYLSGQNGWYQGEISDKDMMRLYEAKCGKAYFDFGRGYNERQTCHYDLTLRDDVLCGEIDVPAGALSCRIDPLEGEYCRIVIAQFCDETGQSIKQNIQSNGILIDDAWYFLDTTDPYFLIHCPCKKITFSYSLTRIKDVVDERIKRQYKIKRSIKKIENGIRRMFDSSQKKRGAYAGYDRDPNYQVWFDENKIKPKEIAEQKMKALELRYQPKISLVVSEKKATGTEIDEMLDSVLAQTYTNWEVCLFTERLLRRNYGKRDSRIFVHRMGKNDAVYRLAKEKASGDYVVILHSVGVLEPNALYEIVKELQQVPADILYTDEDRITDDIFDYRSPRFKPDYSIDLLRSYPYIGELFAVKKHILNQPDICTGSYEYVLRCVEQARSVVHIPHILYHGRCVGEHSMADAQERVIEAHLKRMGESGKVIKADAENLYHPIYKTEGNPLVSVIIANKDHADVLERCIQSLFRVNTYQNFEIIIVENNSTEEETFSYYERVQALHPNVKVLVWEKAFNYSAINNFGVQHAGGDYILLLNNDTQLISPTGVEEMLGNCMRNEVGAVGAKLLYEDDTVQHAGVVIGLGGYAGHVFHGLQRDEKGYMSRLAVNGNYSAVTAACLMTKKTLFEEVGGLTESYQVAANDVDYCLKLREKGYLIVYNAFSEWYHYESKTRGYEDSPEKRERFQKEIADFSKRWKTIQEKGDPYYNNNFRLMEPFILK